MEYGNYKTVCGMRTEYTEGNGISKRCIDFDGADDVSLRRLHVDGPGGEVVTKIDVAEDDGSTSIRVSCQSYPGPRFIDG